MQVTVKLFASLSTYLPAGAVDHAAVLEIADSPTPARIIADLGVPRQHCHLVLINGEYVQPGERDTRTLRDGDTLAIWPPIAGGRGS